MLLACSDQDRQAGFFPGTVFIVSTWYPRHELQQRLAVFYTASAFSGALSGLLAFGIARMDGIRGVAGWRWIFLLEGAVTVTAGLIMPFLIIDTPEKAKWLSDDEKRFIDLRLRLSGVRTATQEGDKFSWKLLGQTMMDWKICLGILLAWANSAPNAAFKFTMPQIIKQLGFSTAHSQLLTMPPYVCGGVTAWLVGRFADKYSWRMPFIVGPMTVLTVALAVLFSQSPKVGNNVPAMYTGVVLAQIGIYPLLPGISAWVGNNLAPSWKRSIGLAWLLAAGNVGSKCISTARQVAKVQHVSNVSRSHWHQHLPRQGRPAVPNRLWHGARHHLPGNVRCRCHGILPLEVQQSQGRAIRV
jgi:sugar phosphate permease